MDFTSDSDVSDGTRDLVRQGLASVKRRRVMTTTQRERPRERTSVPDMDPSQIRHPLPDEKVNGASSTQGLNPIEGKIVQDQNHNTGTAEVGSEVVVEPRSARAELSRRAVRREITSEEMLIAYSEHEREMNELRNNIGRKTNPSEAEALSAWRERVKISRAAAYDDIERRAAILADAAERVRERGYGGSRVIEVVPIRELTANAIVAPDGHSTTATQRKRRRREGGNGNGSRKAKEREERKYE